MKLRIVDTLELLVYFFVLFPSLQAQHVVRLSVDQRPAVELRAIDSLGVTFISLNDLASSLSLTVAVNDTVRKLELRVHHHRIKVTADNPFVVITELSTNSASVSQMPLPVLFHDGTYFAPLSPFLTLFNVLWPGNVVDENETNSLAISSTAKTSEFDITGIEIEPRLNGYLITVLASKRLGEMETWLKPDGWLFLTISNARADTIALSRVKTLGAVRQILTFQSPTSVQLTFKVAPDVVQAEVTNESGTNNLLLSLRTQSESEKVELERKKQAMRKEKLESERSRAKLDVIVIDAGHGGKDPGTIGVSGTREKDVTLAIALELGRLIERNLKDVKVVYTRKTDEFIELYRRAQIANEVGGKLFISIHCNSTERKPSNQNGFEIYLLRPGRTAEAIAIAERENSTVKLEEGYEQRYKELTEENFILVTMAQSAFMKYSERFAEVTAEEMSRHLKIRNSGVRQAGFYVLVGASMPNVLVETGYLSNREEEKVLRSKEGQRKIAEALFQGIREYKVIYERALQDGRATGVN